MGDVLRISPVTRIEGHLDIEVTADTVDNQLQVIDAKAAGMMFRGFEIILKGRDPRDAVHYTQRVCGVCPVSHGMASILAQDEAYGIRPPDNGRLLHNLILGANYIQSHIIHFYHLAALDFVDITAILQYYGKDPLLQGLKSWVQSEHKSNVLSPAAPFLPRYDGSYIEDIELNISAIRHYLEALKMRALAQQMGTLFAGKMPHVASFMPGGAFDDTVGLITKYMTPS